MTVWMLILAIAGGATIEGPTAVDAGDLAVFTASPPGGKWVVIPQEWEARFVAVTLADGRPGLVFASRRQGRITLLYAVCGESGVELARHEFENKSAEPQPPTPPTPPDPPKPDPQPQPKPQPPLRLLWIEESTDRTPAQAAAQNDRAIREAIARAGWSFRVVDDDIVNEHGQTPADLKPFIDQARQLGLPRLIIVDAAGKTWHYPAPADRAAFVGQLQALGLTVTTQTPVTQPARSVRTPVYIYGPSCPGGVCIIGP